MHDLVISRIDASDTAAIRHAVLWPSIPPDAQLLPFDQESTTLHFGAFLLAGDAGKLIGCLTITLEDFRYPDRLPPHLQKPQIAQYQLHKFAVLPEYQGKGVGRELLQRSAEELAQLVGKADAARGGILLHFDARATQTGFYRRMGYEVLDEERFVKRGPTGNGDPVEYVRMGKMLG